MFENDGCTGWFDGWGGISWQKCCDVHDEAFKTGTTIIEFVRANYELWKCIATYDIFSATAAFIGVMTFGVLFYFIPIWLKKKEPRK